MNHFFKTVCKFFRFLFSGRALDATDPIVEEAKPISYKIKIDALRKEMKAESSVSYRRRWFQDKRSKRLINAMTEKEYSSSNALFEAPLAVGDTVEWESQARGTIAVKSGTIIALIPPGVEKWDVIKTVLSPEYAIDRVGGGGVRDHWSYLVEVDGIGSQKRIYHPRVRDIVS